MAQDMIEVIKVRLRKKDLINENHENRSRHYSVVQTKGTVVPPIFNTYI